MTGPAKYMSNCVGMLRDASCIGMLRNAACWTQKLITSTATVAICQRVVEVWDHEKGGLHSVDLRQK